MLYFFWLIVKSMQHIAQSNPCEHFTLSSQYFILNKCLCSCPHSFTDSWPVAPLLPSTRWSSGGSSWAGPTGLRYQCPAWWVSSICPFAVFLTCYRIKLLQSTKLNGSNVHRFKDLRGQQYKWEDNFSWYSCLCLLRYNALLAFWHFLAQTF